MKVKEKNLKEKEADKSRCLNDCEDTLRDKERSLDRARDKLSDAKRDQAVMAGVGVGLTLIPVIGWIAGASVLVVSFTAMQDAVNSASRAVDSARSTRDTTASRLLGIQSDLRSIQNKVSSNLSRLQTSKDKK